MVLQFVQLIFNIEKTNIQQTIFNTMSLSIIAIKFIKCYIKCIRFCIKYLLVGVYTSIPHCSGVIAHYEVIRYKRIN